MGRKAKEYDQGVAKTVEVLSALAFPHQDIADEAGISKAVMERVYEKELKKGKRRVRKKVMGKLLEMIENGDKAAIFFYCKTQLGWRETQSLDVSSSDGSLASKPMVVTFEYVDSKPDGKHKG